MSTKTKPKYKRIAQLKTSQDFREYLEGIGVALNFDDELLTGTGSPFSQSKSLRSGATVGNRFCILPMEGWDGTKEGKPSDLTKRRWLNFSLSGAKLLWGCEAVAVCHEGRANPNQLLINEDNLKDLEKLYQMVVNTHQEKFGSSDDLYTGLQLTHSGRFCKPNDKSTPEPRILYHHPLLDKKFGLKSTYPIMTDGDIDTLIDLYIQGAVLAQKAGFEFVDIKHCHGYLGHEFLSAYFREGRYGGDFDNRTRFLRNIVNGIRTHAPGLEIAIRLSVFDWVPFKTGSNGMGEPELIEEGRYPYAFGGDDTGVGIDMHEISALLKLIEELGIELVCTTAGSPYYNPHIQRPALFHPSDGYEPPEDPLAGVARQIKVTAEMKKTFPGLAIVGSAYSYLQEWLPHVAHHVLRNNGADFVGLGRMVLSYPDMPVDILNNTMLQRKKICRTFSDCTTAPRNGLVSGCYPLDPYYKSLPEAETLKKIKS